MKYSEAIQHIEQSEANSHNDPTPKDTKVWLVVFKGELTITTPLGASTEPNFGCAYAVINSKDGLGFQFGSTSCHNLDLE
jgi:hypothetical protein